jgi:hypothetical protein
MCTVNRRWLSLSLVAGLLLIPAMLMAGEKKMQTSGPYNPKDATVEMFDAMKDGKIAVKFIPKDSTQANVLIENKTDKPLNVKLPEAFAGVPVQAQIGGFGAGGGGRNGGGRNGGGRNNGGNTNQGMGGGMGGMGGMGMGMMNVPPEKIGKIEVTTVCLEHGKAEPKPAAPYEIKPIEDFTQKTGVKELCQMLGTGKIDQRAAQAATWHLTDDMSWQDLAAKHYKYANGTTKPYFSQQELQSAMTLSGDALKAAAENEKKEKDAKQSPSASEKDRVSPSAAAKEEKK